VTGVVEVAVTAPDRALAERLAEALVTERLAACAQVGGPVTSIYRWRGRVERTEEWVCRAKTTLAALPALERRVRAVHPYEMPEILATPVTGDAGYLDWVRAEVSPPTPDGAG
jgi:periplasmic divalent cation tolerance protein